MVRTIKERLTYSHLIQLVGLLATLILGSIWLFKIPVYIGGIEREPEPLLVVAGALGGILLLILPFRFPKLFSDQLIFAGKQEKPLSENTRRQNRAAMLELVKQIWITGYLDNVLNQMQSLNLKLEFAEPEKVLRRPAMQDYKLPDNKAIHKIFNDLNHHLVILGEPGAGKTVLLLQLARELITEARDDLNKPIPVVLALSSWAARQPPFEEWLVDELRTLYNLPQKAVDDLVKGEQLLYLLDGLDEVAQEHSDTCLQAIKKFMEEDRPGVSCVVSSRFAEFQAIPTRLDIPGEVVLQPLNLSQIDHYLSDEEFEGLRTVMADNTIIQDFAHIPFMLNTMAVVTRAVAERNILLAIESLDDPAHLRDYFLEAYLNRRLREKPNPRYADFRQTRTYLKWLAVQLVRRDQTDYYIENLQMDWLESDSQKKYYRWSVGLVVGLVVGLGFGLGDGLKFGLVGGLVLALLIGLGFGLAGKSKIEMADHLIWSFPWPTLVSGLAVLLVSGLIFGLISELAVGLVFGLGYGLVVALVLVLVSGFGSREMIQIRLHPAEGLRRSLTNGLLMLCLVGLALALPVGLVVGLAGDRTGWPVGWLTIVLAFGLRGGLGALIQHAILRLFLARAGHIPRWRYDRFLDYAYDLVILRKVGGGYRFVHDYMRRYLASATFVPDAMQKSSNDAQPY
jgi:NACHT domain-containing protein